ncbi:MAG: hypothetical protein FWB93_04855 [Oscillospiraceae bacterium]|nr:hypothetical protein [Oscillospiraceae bacterium]
MKRSISVLSTLSAFLALFMLFILLVGCGDNGYDRQQIFLPPTTAQPIREGAVIVPAQGGAMLFPFLGSDDIGLYGIVNDFGEIVAEPRYDRIDYITDWQNNATGLFARRMSTIYHYDLYGNATEFPFDATTIVSSPNGRFWRIFLNDNRHGMHGIWDVEAGEFIFSMSATTRFGSFDPSEMFFGRVFQTANCNWNNPVRTFYFCTYTKASRYFPENWVGTSFCATSRTFLVERTTASGREHSAVDWNMNFVDRNSIHHTPTKFLIQSQTGVFTLVIRNGVQYLIDESGAVVYFTATENQFFRPFHDFKNNQSFMVLYFQEERGDFHGTATNTPIKAWDAFSGELIDIDVLINIFDRNDKLRQVVNDYFRENYPQNFSFAEVLTADGMIFRNTSHMRMYEVNILAVDWEGKIFEHPLLPFVWKRHATAPKSSPPCLPKLLLGGASGTARDNQPTR